MNSARWGSEFKRSLSWTSWNHLGHNFFGGMEIVPWSIKTTIRVCPKFYMKLFSHILGVCPSSGLGGWFSKQVYKAYGCGLWCGIISFKPWFTSNIRLVLGNRKNNNFWLILGLMRSLLGSSFLEFFCKSRLKQGRVSDFWRIVDQHVCWDYTLEEDSISSFFATLC